MRNNQFSVGSFSIGFFLLALCGIVNSAQADDWLPVSQEELKMTSEPKAPTAAAIYLYRQVDRDDNASTMVVYSRIKILTEDGRKYADVELSFNKGSERIRGIEARTIRPDGSIVNFNGTVYEKPIVKGRGVRLYAKAFTLSDVQVGSIIEYRYRFDLQEGFVFDSHWILSEELFTKHAKFSLVQSQYFPMRYSWPVGLPPGTAPPKNERNKVRLETRDVAAFITEDYMPPARELQYRVDFIYLADSNSEKEPDAYWKKFGKEKFKRVDSYLNERRAMEAAVAGIVDVADSPETKLRKIYARTQQLRNVSFEREKSEQEAKREAQKEARDVADVWKRGYGDGIEITWLFVGLARAAGFEADPVLVSTRNEHFFNPAIMNPTQINSNIAVVKLDGKDLYLDPGTAHVPFGLLPWSETAVKGLRLDKNGGTWITTPITTPEDGRIVRKANLRLTTNGSVEGSVKVTYSGLEATWRRIAERNEDETERKDFLEQDFASDIPTGADITLTNKPEWNSSEPVLVAEFEIKVPGWMDGVGQKGVLPTGLFSADEKRTFKHASRAHPLYFNFPFKREDDITIALPTGWQVQSLPPPHDDDKKVAKFKSAATKNDGALHLSREVSINLLLLDKKFYLSLRDFYQGVRTADEEQVVVGPATNPSKPATKR